MSQQYVPPYPQQQQTGYQPPPGFAYTQPPPAYVYPPQQQQSNPWQQNYNDQSYTTVNDMPNTDTTNTWAGFSDKNIRRLFVQKVYSILSIQLFITFGLTALVVLIDPIKTWFRAHVWLYYVAYVIFLSLYITLICCEGPRRKHPTNLILLGIFTLALSFMVAMICTFHDLFSVLIAAGITAVCCLAVSVLSCHTKFDFTRLGWALFIAALALMIAGILAIIIRSKALLIVYAAAGTVIFLLFLAYDTQLILGGKKYQLSAEEYVLGSLLLYIDIVYIFLFILQLVGASKN